MAVRLALVLAFLDAVSEETERLPTCIGLGDLDRAIAHVQDYLLPMAFRAYGEASIPPEERGARRIARLIHEEKLTEFSIRDVQRRGLSGLKYAKDVVAALDILTSAAWVTCTSEQSATRPRLIYTVDPRVHAPPQA